MKSGFLKVLVLLIVFCQLLSNKTYSQSSGVSKTPEEQIKFKDNISQFSQVDFVSGNPNININLWNIELNGFTLPITLNYNINSVKVDNISSWVGFGWNLDIGGSISRNIKDFPDDIKANRNTGFYTGKKFGYMKGGANRVKDFRMDYPETWRNTNELINTMGTITHFDDNKQAYKVCPDGDGIFGPFYDTEPDEFNVNIPGYNQKFFFNQNNQPKFIPYSNLKMSYQMDDAIVNPDANLPWKYSTKGITSLEVYDEKGNKYIFGEPIIASHYAGSDRWGIYYPGIEAVEPANYQAGIIQYVCTLEWKLSKIVTKNGDEINFTYETQEVEYGGVSYKAKNDRSHYWCQYFNKVIKKEKRLVSIETKNELIQFIAYENRLDLFNSKGLNTIAIFNKVNGTTALKRRFELDLGYFQSDVSEPRAYEFSMLSKDDFYKRLKLLSISEVGLDGFAKKHVFEYNEKFQLPGRLSAKKDFWSYFNNQNNIGKDGLHPTIMVYPTLRAPDKISVFDYDNDGSGTPYYYLKSNRFPSSDGDIAGAFGLKKITYPTGGTHAFTFEPNTYFYKNKNFTGGGLRLKEENVYEPVTKKTITKKYDYSDMTDPNKSSGKIINFPVFAFPENTAGYQTHDGSGYYVDPYQVNSNINYNYYNYFLSCNSEPEWALGSYERNNVEYRFIKETVEVDGKTDGYNRYEFKAFDFKEMMSNNYVFFPHPIPWSTGYFYYSSGDNNTNCSSTPTPFAGRWFDQEFDSYADTRGLEFDQCSYPICPYSSYEWNRGQLLNKLVYDATNKIVGSETYHYEDFKSFEMDDLVQGLQIRVFENYNMGKARTIDPSAHGNNNAMFNNFIVYTPYKYYTSNKTVLKNKETKVYSSPTSYITSETSYEYNSKGQLQAETFTNSKNICKKTVYTYPSDLTIGTTNDPLALTVSDMQKKNQIEEALEKVTYDNCAGQLSALSSELTLFKSHVSGNNKVIVPFEVHRLENKQAVTFSPVQYSNGSIKWDNKYKRYNNLTIDSKGNLSQQNKENDVKNSYIWGFNQTYPIASVEGAGYNDIAYTSFEENDNGYGGWAVPNPFFISGYAVTGKNNFSLNNGNVYTTRPLNPSTVYILSFWFCCGGIPDIPGEIKSITYPSHLVNGWMYVEKEITGVSSITIKSEDGASGQLDELRLYPKGAKMTTFTYDPLIGATAKCDERNLITYYEYDGFGRLSIIRDQNKNILKKICYNYAGQSESSGCAVVGNDEQVRTFTRNTCGTGYVGTSYIVRVPADTYFASTVEQANAIALADIDANGQAKADTLGQCVLGNVYAKVRMENPQYPGRYTIGDVVVRFYSDPAYTIPVSVTNLSVNFRQMYYYGLTDTNTPTYFTQTCSGSAITIRSQIVLFYNDSDIGYDYSFFIEPGAGYIYSTQYTWPN